MKLLAVLLPLLFWQQGIETAPALKQAGIERIAVTPDKADAWRKAGFTVVPMTEAELKSREKLATPGAAGRPGLAAATGRPWLDANGWPFVTRQASFITTCQKAEPRWPPPKASPTMPMR